MEFDLEQWQQLARDDPEQFERQRKEAIESLIAQAPVELRGRLRALQCRIDLERRRAKSPLEATMRLQSMMWERFAQLREALLSLTAESYTPAPSRERGRVLPFSKPD